MSDDMVDVQVQMENGNWRTYNTVVNNPSYYLKAMQNLQRSHPGKRIRTADKSGRMIDML